jgi:hypothetical protein
MNRLLPSLHSINRGENRRFERRDCVTLVLSLSRLKIYFYRLLDFWNIVDGSIRHIRKDHLAVEQVVNCGTRGASSLTHKSTCNHLRLCMGNKTDGRIHLSPSILWLHLCFGPLTSFFLFWENRRRQNRDLSHFSPRFFKRKSHNSLCQFGSNHITFYFSANNPFLFFNYKKQNKKQKQKGIIDWIILLLWHDFNLEPVVLNQVYATAGWVTLLPVDSNCSINRSY